MDGSVNLLVPRGNERELVSHGEIGYIPFRTSAPNGAVWLVRVPPHVVPYLTKAGFWPAPDELQAARPPQGPIRGVTAHPLIWGIGVKRKFSASRTAFLRKL
jgi:hypothetical protein